jgi:acetoin utilization protein AcuB
MTRRVIVAPPQMSLAAAWEVMQRERFRHLPVVSSNLLVGILSDRDVLLHATTDGHEVSVPDIAVATAMSPAPYVCLPSTHVADVVRTMTERKIDALPVVDDESHLVGLVTSTDLLLLLIELEEAKLPIPFDFELDELPSSVPTP